MDLKEVFNISSILLLIIFPDKLKLTRAVGQQCSVEESTPVPYHLLTMEVDWYIIPIAGYEWNELEPYISVETMEAHILGHHNFYRRGVNKALEQWRTEEPENDFAKSSILNIVQNLDKVPEKYRTDLRNYGGGFVNHCFYFGVLSPNEDGTERLPTGALLDDINEAFGGVEEVKRLFNEEAKYLFGSGYVWLYRKPNGKHPNLFISTTKDQDSPVMDGNLPILVLDLWEHAYYLKNNYRRWDHLKDFWTVVDWEAVARLDAWWVNQEEEQIKADKRVDEVRETIENRRRMKEEKEALDSAKEEEKKEKKKQEL